MLKADIVALVEIIIDRDHSGLSILVLLLEGDGLRMSTVFAVLAAPGERLHHVLLLIGGLAPMGDAEPDALKLAQNLECLRHGECIIARLLSGLDGLKLLDEAVILHWVVLVRSCSGRNGLRGGAV